MKGELSGRLEGSLRDVVPLLTSIWEWMQAHYLVVMGFVLMLAVVGAIKRMKGNG